MIAAAFFWLLGHALTIIRHMLTVLVIAGVTELVIRLTGLPYAVKVPSFFSLFGALFVLDGAITIARLAWKAPRIEFVQTYNGWTAIEVDPDRRVKVPE